MKTFSIAILILFALAISVSFGSCTGNVPNITTSAEHVLAAQPNGKTVFRLVNNGPHVAVFNIKVNNTFRYSQADLVDSIKRLNATLQEPLELTAWRMVKQLTINEKPLTMNTSQYTPEVFINSVGAGYCGDEAAVLAELWRALGFKSRLWLLEGHVVPEVFTSGRWHMFDPSLKVYYLNEDNTVASVEELAAHPEYFDKVIPNDLPESPFFRAFCQSKYIRHLYATTINNEILDNWGSTTHQSTDFCLPPGASAEFPAQYLPSTTLSKQYAQWKLEVPQGWVGDIPSPLVLQHVEGSGQIAIDSVVYEIGSVTLNDLLAAKDLLVTSIRVTQSTSHLKLFYLINPLSIGIKDTSIIKLSGVNIDSVFVTSSLADSSIALYNAVPYKFQLRVVSDYKYYDSIGAFNDSLWHFAAHPITDSLSLSVKIDTYLLLDKRLSSTQANSLRPLINNGLASLMADSRETFIKIMQDPEIFVLMASIMKHMVNEEDPS